MPLGGSIVKIKVTLYRYVFKMNDFIHNYHRKHLYKRRRKDTSDLLWGNIIQISCMTQLNVQKFNNAYLTRSKKQIKKILSTLFSFLFLIFCKELSYIGLFCCWIVWVDLGKRGQLQCNVDNRSLINKNKYTPSLCFRWVITFKSFLFGRHPFSKSRISLNNDLGRNFYLILSEFSTPRAEKPKTTQTWGDVWAEGACVIGRLMTLITHRSDEYWCYFV